MKGAVSGQGISRDTEDASEPTIDAVNQDAVSGHSPSGVAEQHSWKSDYQY